MATKPSGGPNRSLYGVYRTAPRFPVEGAHLAFHERREVAGNAPLRRTASSDREPNGTTERGKEKKQRLLSYSREHPEELRPASV